jgi:hypothetical protein
MHKAAHRLSMTVSGNYRFATEKKGSPERSVLFDFLGKIFIQLTDPSRKQLNKQLERKLC